MGSLFDGYGRRCRLPAQTATFCLGARLLPGCLSVYIYRAAARFCGSCRADGAGTTLFSALLRGLWRGDLRGWRFRGGLDGTGRCLYLFLHVLRCSACRSAPSTYAAVLRASLRRSRASSVSLRQTVHFKRTLRRARFLAFSLILRVFTRRISAVAFILFAASFLLFSGCCLCGGVCYLPGAFLDRVGICGFNGIGSAAKTFIGVTTYLSSSVIADGWLSAFFSRMDVVLCSQTGSSAGWRRWRALTPVPMLTDNVPT